MSTVTWPDHLLTLEEWDALADDDTYRWAELVEGVLQMAPQPTSRHQVASFQLCVQLNRAFASAGLFAIQDVEVVLRPEFPPLVRVPDLSVVTRELVRTQPPRYAGEQIQLAVEIMSPGTRRIDRIMKLADYAEAGIPNYWIVDLDGPVALDAFHLVDGRYEPVLTGACGVVRLEQPGWIDLELDQLVPRSPHRSPPSRTVKARRADQTGVIRPPLSR